MPNRILPFARGQTLYEGATSVDDTAKRIIGQCFEVPDTLHGSGGRVTLRAVQNDKTSAITPALKGYKFGSGTKDEWGAKVTGEVTTNGGHGKPMDDYTRITGLASIVDHDVFFVVEEGNCRVLKTATTSFTAGDAVMFGDTGKAEEATDKAVIIGTATTAAGASATNMVVRVIRGITTTQSSI